MKKILNQHKIDTGQLGGLISVFGNSLIILSPFSFIGIVALNYDRYIKHWLDLNTFIVISVISFIFYEWIFFVFVYPSIIQFSNRQICAHENPIYNDIKDIKASIEEIKNELKKYP